MLYDPELNISFGTWYLAKLLEDYDSQLVFAIASYNAGEEAVNRWKKRNNYKNMEEFIENISYPETRKYVKKVLRKYWLYKKIYPSAS